MKRAAVTVPPYPPAATVTAPAIHESGHAIVALALGCDFGALTIRPSEGRGGLTWLHVRTSRDAEAHRTHARNGIVVCCAGVEAERHLVPRLVRAGSDDADRDLIAMLLERACDAGDPPHAIVALCQKQAAVLVRRYATRIQHCAQYLVANETLRASDVRMLWALHERAALATKGEKFAVRRGDLG
jgi:hypothetical protein